MTKQKTTGATMELLAPAGSFAAFEAAITEGADAVYVGASGLNARALSRDFTYQEIASMVKYAHDRGVKLYIAMNTLVKEDELEQVVEALAAFEALKPDALIIQDMGLMKLAFKYFPDLSLHASTLFSIHNSMAVKQMVDLGIERIVLPRELTIDEIRSVFQETGAKLEIFVHGAMCFSYSGLCLFSSMHGGKSSLRGQCVQPCRRRYSWLKKNVGKKGSASEKGGGHLFSMNDLSGIELLPRLHRAGVACLKIEGRMKSAEYVRKTVRAYRLVLDGGKRPGQNVLHEAGKLLDEAMGRRRSAGFFRNRKPEEAVTPHLSGNIGTMVGKVKRLDEKRLGPTRFQSLLTVQLRQEIKIGDRLRLHDETTGERISFSLRTLKQGKSLVKHASSGRNVTVVLEQALPKRKGKGTKFLGSLFRVDSGSRGRDEKDAKTRILGTGRRAVQPDQHRIKQVLQKVTGVRGEGRVAVARQPAARKTQWWVQVASLLDIYLRLPIPVTRYIVPLSPENMKLLQRKNVKAGQQLSQIVWSLPPVILDDEISWYHDTVAALVSAGFTGFQLGHFSQRGLFAKYLAAPDRIHLCGSYTLNMLNSMSLQALGEFGFSALQFSIETDQKNLHQAVRNLRSRVNEGREIAGIPEIGLYVFGRPPLFTSRLDDSGYRYGKRFKSPRGEVFSLTRSGSLTCARSVLFFSLLRWRRELGKTGVDYLVVDLSEGNVRRNVAEFTAQYFQRDREIQVLEGNFQNGLV